MNRQLQHTTRPVWLRRLALLWLLIFCLAMAWQAGGAPQKQPPARRTVHGQPDPATLPSGTVELNGHYFYLNRCGPITWQDAQQRCQDAGGHLATVTSQQEAELLAGQLNGDERMWLGGYRSDSGSWNWVSGESWQFAQWAPGQPLEPDHAATAARYLAIQRDGWLVQTDEDGPAQSGYICEWEYGSSVMPATPAPALPPGSTPAPTPAPVIPSSASDRDVVLVLDVSGSMYGTPLEETKKASINFISTVLQEGARISVVAFANDAQVVSDFSTDETVLVNAVNGLDTYGGTNTEAGLRSAQLLLSGSAAKKKIIVLMSDGEPNNGRVGDDLIAYADSIKQQDILIYTLGFFESLSYKAPAQALMNALASDGCHYEVSDADSLVFFFEDIADQINGQRYIYIRIACPVDVTIRYGGETLTSDADRQNLRTDFGTITFEESEEAETSGDASPGGSEEDTTDDLIKVVRLKEGVDYDVQIVGTGRGSMDYTIGFMDGEGEYNDFRRFERVRITRNTVIDTVATVSDESVLNIDEDGDGRYDLRLRAEANGYGEEVRTPLWVYIAMGGGAALLLLVLVLILVLAIRKRNKKKHMRRKVW